MCFGLSGWFYFRYQYQWCMYLEVNTAEWGFWMSFSWHFSYSWHQLGVSGEVRQQPPFFLTQQYTNFMMLLDRSDLHFWAAQTSWITWHRWFCELEFGSFSITNPGTSHFKISQNQAKIQKKLLNPPIIKNKGKSGHFGKTSIGSFSELKYFF